MKDWFDFWFCFFLFGLCAFWIVGANGFAWGNFFPSIPGEFIWFGRAFFGFLSFAVMGLMIHLLGEMKKALRKQCKP